MRNQIPVSVERRVKSTRARGVSAWQRVGSSLPITHF